MNTTFKHLITTGLCSAFILGASAASAGQLTGLNVPKKFVKVGESVPMVVSGTAQCAVMINDGNGKAWQIALTDPSNPPSKTFDALYNKAGKFHLTATANNVGKVACNTAPAMAVDITVLGTPPACTFDKAVQKEYLEIGVQVKTCEVLSTPPTKINNRADTTVDTTAVVANPKPGLAVAHTKITSLQVSGTQLTAGATLTVKVYGTGLETQCPTTVSIEHKGLTKWKYTNQASTGAWPRVSTYVLPEAGKYFVRIAPLEMVSLSAAEILACGFTMAYNNTGIPGDLTIVEVSDIPK